jgi:hypothetical protein
LTNILKGFLALVVLIALGAVSPTQAQMLDDVAQALTPLASQGVEVAGKMATHVFQSGPVNQPFTGVMVEAYASDRDLAAAIRFRRNGAWKPWQTMRLVRSAVGDGLVAGYRGDRLLPAVSFEVRFTVDSASALEVRSAGLFDNTLDSDALPAPAPGVLAPVAGADSGTIIPPALITRADWGAKDFKGSPSALARPSHDFMTFHHAAGYSATTRSEGIQQLKAIQDLHQDIRGWSDIGYQFVIDRGGRLYQGRPFLNNATSLEDLPVFAMGAHVGGANTGNIGVSMLGCYHPPEGGTCTQEITPEALDTYTTLFAFLSERYGVAPTQIRGHRDFSSTACPGDNNYVLLPALRTAVANLLETGNAPIATASMSALVSQDGVVTVAWDFTSDFGVATYRVERWIGGSRDAVLATGAGTAPASIADGGVVTGQTVSYRLYVTGTDGREQRVGTIDVSLDLPSQHALADVFPNPANGSVHFRYYLPTEGRVRLELFDTMGRSVAVAVDAVQDGERWYAIPFDAGQLPGGVYFYRVLVEGFAGLIFDQTNTLVVTP